MQFLVEKAKNLWNGWEIRVLVLLSLSLQIILISFSSRRKYIAKSWINMLVWLAYLGADWVATVALGNLATSSQGDFGDNSPKQSQQLQAFWAPFLLLHLGGPDTITAYSLEDNELWLRHLLGLVVQVGVAFYVFIHSWSNNAIAFLAIPVFIAGVIKYGERTWILRSSSSEKFRDSLLSTPDPSPSLVRNMKGDVEDQLEGNGSHELLESYLLFKRFSHLFSGLILTYRESTTSRRILDRKSTKEAFNLVAIELGFMYDVLYTKVTIVYSRLGIFLRCISFLSSIFALVSFSVIVNIHAYPLTDICITYILLVGAIVLEIYAFLLHFASDWTKLIYLIKSKNSKHNVYGAICSSHALLTNHKRWSVSMGQFNLISFSLKDILVTSPYIRFKKLLGFTKLLEKYSYLTWKGVNLDLLEIFNSQIINLSQKNNGHDFLKGDKSILDRRGDGVLEEKYHFDLSDYDWFIFNREFDESLLIWHIATDLCYFEDLSRLGDDVVRHLQCQISRCLSDYMLYLLMLCPAMMPKGNGELRFRDTCDEATKFFESKRSETLKKESEAYKMLYERERKISDRDDLSVLVAGCQLANDLQKLEFKDDWGNEKKWEMMRDVWVEMLTYAANHCEWKEHGQQLKKGGELLTHVCLLMAHYGLSAQYDQEGRNII